MKKFYFVLLLFILLDIFGKVLFGYQYINLYKIYTDTFNLKLLIDFIYFSLVIYFLFFSRLRVVIILLYTLTLIDFGHFYLFKTHIMPFEWHLALFNIDDIFDALVNNIFLLFGLIFLLAVLIFILFSHKKTKKYFLFIGVFLLLIPFVSKTKVTTFKPSNKHLTYNNSILSFDRFIYELMTHKQRKQNYKDYIYQKNKESKPLVMLVMGESLNYKRMHLFGWDTNNTPNLDSLKSNPNFQYKKSISYATETTTSISSFFYNKREPYNINVITNDDIITLAHKNGYKVYWLSMQIDRGKLLPKFVNESDIHIIRKDFKRKFDDELLKKLQTLKLAKKSFVILHLRANHYAYEDYTPKEFYKFKFNKKGDYHNYMVNSYMNSILYVDKLIFDCIGFLKKTNKNFSFYFTSDHGEMLGFPEEKGRYLHLILDKHVSYVPFLYYSDKNCRDLNKSFYPHYEISKMITEDLGYTLINPNEEKNIYYINAPQFDGSSGFIEYNISKWKD